MSGCVVAVVAHPDDESLIAGGTLALAARAGIRTGVVSLTRGEQGPIATPGLASRGRLGEVREAELTEAAHALGLDWAACLTHPDGELPWIDHDLAAAELAALLAPHGPDVILTFGEDGLYGHADHTATGVIVALANARLEDPADIYEATWSYRQVPRLVAAAAARGLPHALWGLEPEAFGTDRSPDLIVDVRAVLHQKLSALRAHRTQLGEEHLLSRLPLDLAERHLGSEPWSGPAAGRLAELLQRA